MKSFKNHFLMLLALTVGFLDVQITKTVDEYTETELTPPPARIPERQPDRLRDFMSRFSKKNNGPLLEYNSKDKSISRGSSHYNASNESDDDMFTPIKPQELNREQLNQPSKGFVDRFSDFFKKSQSESVRINSSRVAKLDDWQNVKPEDYEPKLDEGQKQNISNQGVIQKIRDAYKTFKDNRTSTKNATNEPVALIQERLDEIDQLTTKLPSMLPSEIKNISPQDIQDLSTDINTLTAEQINALTPDQIQNMTIDQILTFNKEQIQNFNFKDLTIQQIKQLVQLRSTGLLQNLTDSQLLSLSSEQMEACLEARPETFTEEQLDSLRQLLRLRGGSAAKIWLKDLTMKNFKNIFKSDSDLLEKYLTDPSTRTERLERLEVRKALAKLSRTQTAKLFTKITQNEIAEIRKKNPTLSKDAVEKLYIETFNKNERSFKTLLKDSDPAGTKQYILIPSRPADMQANSLVNFKFEILDISEYDPNLTIAENAERLKKSQDLSIRANRFSPESPTNDLATYMKNYLEDNPNTKNLKALLVNDFTALNRTTNVADAQAELAKILNTSPRMESLFRNLTADQLTDITKAQIKAQEKNMNLAGRGAKVSYEEAQRIFKQNAEIYQKFAKPNTLIIPAEDASRKNQDSFTFDIIDISSIKDELNKINMPNVNIEKYFAPRNQNLTDNSPEYNEMINNTGKLINLANKLKSEQDLKLNISEIAIELKNYIAKDKAPSVSENEDVKNYTLTRDGKTLKSSINFKGAPYDESIAQATKILGKKAVQAIREKTLGETQGRKLTGPEKIEFKNALETVINQLIEANSKEN
jgi:hypothetical protein